MPVDNKARVAIGRAARQQIDEPYFLFYVGMGRDGPTGYMLVDNVIGKTEPITYMVVFNPDGSVRRMEIMVYREPRGGEVRYKAFLKQYEGKSIRDPLRLSDDIRNISGATLSTISISFGVKKLLAVYHYLFLGEIPAGKEVVRPPGSRIMPGMMFPIFK